MMPNTYTQIYIQLVFATKGRDSQITNLVREEIEKYICGIFNNKGQKVMAIYANPDHVHIFFSYKNLQITISDLVKVVKTESTNFINEKKLCVNHFTWQQGYGAFSYAKSQKERVVNYILNQETHHEKKSFRDEYVEFLNAFEIEFKDEYLFEFYD
ncbi:IS200/IS605 family transposase [Chryseobacterium sp. ST-37]|uniref:IS200/IS605 family transposase n=1 Tax=Chryseobacterium terrae TaxID=3163299 RepID=A0ABW8Y547_9FLAO